VQNNKKVNFFGILIALGEGMKQTVEVKSAALFELDSIRLPFRTDLNLTRKIWHMSMGLFIVFVYLQGISQSLALGLLSFSLVGDLMIENARLRNPSLNVKMMRFWGNIMRAHEKNQMSTIPHYITAVIVAVGLFPKPVGVLSILYLACGDPMASVFGILFGDLGPRFKSGKSLIGSLAGVGVCSLITGIYLSSARLVDSSLLLWVLALLGGLVGGLAELLPVEIDDNFIIPVVSGFALWAIFIAFGI
jgi:diacylglycerol kinase (CTP)